jgi:LysR family hca operon transcriptional activator
MRAEPDRPALAYRVVVREPLMVVMANDHRLAGQDAITIQDVAKETFLGMSKTAPTLQATIENYLKHAGVAIRAAHEVDNLSMAMSLVASTGGVTLLPAYARNFLPRSLTIRPLAGEVPAIDLVVGYQTANPSPILRLFLSRIDALIARVARKSTF